jgi:hypothetical protein
MCTLTDEIECRRTLAIISHPDAAKITLTEKLLLFSGAIQLTGEVKARGGGCARMDSGRARARYLGLVGGEELRASGARLQPARHPRAI